MKTILLIEDNNELLDNLTEYFELEGYRILGAKNGKSGVEISLKFQPDLIVCDVIMSEMNGYEILQLLLESPQTSDIPFIFSTSMSEKKHREKAMKLGADDYIIKPYDIEALLKMVEARIKCGSIRSKILDYHKV